MSKPDYHELTGADNIESVSTHGNCEEIEIWQWRYYTLSGEDDRYKYVVVNTAEERVLFVTKRSYPNDLGTSRDEVAARAIRYVDGYLEAHPVDGPKW